jgi:hypothetical protein
MAAAMAWLCAADVATGCVVWFNEITLLVNGMTPTFPEDNLNLSHEIAGPSGRAV